MPALRNDIDPDGLLEYSVVFTDRALNHMSQKFQGVMRDIGAVLKQVYSAPSAIVVPGSGTFGMEAVARQFATGKSVLVVRNGWFSYRWTQIFDSGQIPSQQTVLKARAVKPGHQAAFAPPALADAVAAIRQHKPAVVFAPHVETSSGIMLPDAYLRGLADAVHEAGGLFVLDCIASGAMWVDMRRSGVDVLISAPQKGWSGSPCCAFVMLSQAAREAIDSTEGTSFSLDLKKWLQIMQAYENGGHAYHATMPTDALTSTRDAMLESRSYGFDKLRSEQLELGHKVRRMLESNGLPSVAAEGFQAPGVVVSYTDIDSLSSGQDFIGEGIQAAAGVPLKCDEPADFKTFRIGLFGLDKLHHVERSVANLESALKRILKAREAARAAA